MFETLNLIIEGSMISLVVITITIVGLKIANTIKEEIKEFLS